MGVVYDAIRSDGSHVAIKTLRQEQRDDPRARRRFHDEATVGQLVHHPRVASVIDHDEANGIPFLVMSLVPGESLGTVIRRDGTPSLERAVSIGVQILDALDAIHRAGIVHGDVKSDNVLICRDGDGSDGVTLIDFGLAHLQDTEAEPADEGSTLVSGTPEYMAPEVARGLAPTTQSDLYAAGVILYELLVGATPFAGGPAALILCRQLRDIVIPPSLRCPEREIPFALERIVLRALRKEPRRRFRSARRFLQALMRIELHGAADLTGCSHGRLTLDGSTSIDEAAPTIDRHPRTVCVETAGLPGAVDASSMNRRYP